MTETIAVAPTANTSHRPEAAPTAQPASDIRTVPVSTPRQSAPIITFAAPPATVAEEATGYAARSTSATTAASEPTGTASAAALAFLEDFLREVGPIPDEIVAEVQQKWRD